MFFHLNQKISLKYKLLYVFVSILFGTSNSISLNLMLPKLKIFNVLPNDHKWLWHSQRLLKKSRKRGDRRFQKFYRIKSLLIKFWQKLIMNKVWNYFKVNKSSHLKIFRHKWCENNCNGPGTRFVQAILKTRWKTLVRNHSNDEMSFAIFESNQIFLLIHNYNKNGPLLVLIFNQV